MDYKTIIILSAILSGLLIINSPSNNPSSSSADSKSEVFIFLWITFMIFGSILKCCFCSSGSSNDRGNYARNNIAHRADAFNPENRRYNPNAQYGPGKSDTARRRQDWARQNNEYVRNNYWE